MFTTSCVYVLQVECSALKGWALQQKESQIAQVQKQLLRLPEDVTLADIEVRTCNYTTLCSEVTLHCACSLPSVCSAAVHWLLQTACMYTWNLL
jgi:hypothetical protein